MPIPLSSHITELSHLGRGKHYKKAKKKNKNVLLPRFGSDSELGGTYQEPKSCANVRDLGV